MDKNIRLQMAQLNINNENIPLYEGVNTIGRNKEAVVNIKDINISQNHAIVVIMDGQQFISDLRSSNGSFYEDSKMVPFKLYQLKNHAKVVLGNLSGTYVCQGPFSTEVESSQKGLVNTQSVYGCNTQLLGCSVTQSLDIHEAPTQEISWASVKPNKASTHNLNPLQTNSNIDTKPNHPDLIDNMKGLSDNFNDENLPLLENNDNFTVNLDAETNLYEEQTEDIELKKPQFTNALEDDESTDCEEDNNIKLGKSDELDIPKDDIRKSPQNLPQFDNDSNDSIEFLKFEKSLANSGMESTTIDKIDSKAGSLDCDSENFTYKRTKKSLMVISTQDLCEHSLDSTKNELEIDSSVIENIPVGSSKKNNETDMELTINRFDQSIPATQNQSVTDLDDSDFIAATQEVKTCLLDRQQKKNVGLSEESFKLGLTELMTDSSQDVQECHKSGSLDDLTEEVRVNIEPDEFISVNVTAPNYTVLEPTQNENLDESKSQPVLCSNEAKSSSTSQENTDIYDAPTEKVQVSKQVDPNYTVVDPTQNENLDESKSQPVLCSNEAKPSCTSQENTDIYDAPTEKVQVSKQVDPNYTVLEPAQNGIHGETKSAPIVCEAKLCSTSQESTEIYDGPTEEVQVNIKRDEYLYLNTVAREKQDECKPLSVLCSNETKLCSTFHDNTDIYDAPTQRVCIDQKNMSSDEELDAASETYLAPTQRLYEVDILLTDGNLILETDSTSSNSTSKIVSLDKSKDSTKVDGTSGINKMTKRTFSFKKKPCDLEASLSALTDNNIVQTNEASELPTSVSSSCNKLQAEKESVNNISTIAEKNEHISDFVDNVEISSSYSKIKYNLKDRNMAKTLNTEMHLDFPKSISNVQSITHSNDGKLDSSKTKSEVNTDASGSGLHTTNYEINKSVAMLESKIIKTRRNKKATEIQITVPRTRRSMSISKIEENPNKSESSDNQKSISKGNLTGEEKDTGSTSDNRKNTKRNRSSTKHFEILGSEQMKRPKSVAQKLNKITADNNSTRSSNGLVDNNNSESLKKSSRRTLRSRPINKNENVNNITQDSYIDKTNQIQIDVNTSCSKSETLMKRKSDNTSIEKNTLPKKQKLMQRGLRKERPKVVFTMMESPRLESLIKQLGGSVVESVEACTVLVTERIKRSQKLLSAIGLGKPICSPKWITDSKSMQEFLDPWDYILTDPEAETKWNFSLKESLSQSRAHQLLKTYSFHIQILNAADVLKGAIEACGGKCLSKIPTTPLEDAYIISSPDNRNKFNKILKKHPHFKVIEAEAIFDGVLRQEIRFSKHILR